LLPLVYDYPDVKIEEILRQVEYRLTAAETQYLQERFYSVRKKKHLISLNRGDEYVVLPLRPDFDPRRLPVAVLWCDGGFYTSKARDLPGGSKLRKLGLRDGIAGYVSYKALLLNPPQGRPSWQIDPSEIKVTSSYAAEVIAVKTALQGLITFLESEKNLPAVADFHVVIFSDCQSLIDALNGGTASAEAEAIERVRQLAALFGGVYPRWEGRRRIKQRLGH
jgi:hypothetical protein